MARKVIITCAITGGAADSPHKSPAVPVTPEEIVTSALEAREAGAAITHIHVRDPETKRGSMAVELYAEVMERLRASNTDLVINLTTGTGAFFMPSAEDPRVADAESTITDPVRRVLHVEEFRPEVCSLDVATMNFADRAFLNVPGHLRIMAERIAAAGTRPELECFDVGHVRLARHLIEQGPVPAPGMFQLCLGINWGAPATVQSMAHMRDLLPDDAVWSAFGIGPTEFPMVAAAVLLGGHARVGLEDNLYLARGELAPNNAALVERAAGIVRLMGEEVATPDDARDILGLAG